MDALRSAKLKASVYSPAGKCSHILRLFLFYVDGFFMLTEFYVGGL